MRTLIVSFPTFRVLLTALVAVSLNASSLVAQDGAIAGTVKDAKTGAALSTVQVERATLVAGGIKVALITTATGLTIAIPINIMHNYFVSKVDRMVIDMEESAQKMIDAVHARDRGAAI